MKKKTNAPKERPREAAEEPAAPTPAWVGHLCWAAPLAVFLVMRLFSADPYYLLGGDQCTYLQLGRTFPKHQLFNHELYLLHPPLLGYLIGIAHLAMPLLAAGLVTTLALAVLNLFVVRKLGLFEGLPAAAIGVGLLYVALSRPGIVYDYHVARISPLVCATAAALLAFLKLVRAPSGKTLAWSVAANVVCLMISDQAVLLLPCEAVLLLARGWRGVGWGRVALLTGVSVAASALWPVVRLMRYRAHDELPAGIDGMIEFTKSAPWKAVIQPNFLPFTDAHRALFTQTSLSLGNLDVGKLFSLLFDMALLPTPLSAILILALSAAAFGRKEARRRSSQWLGLSMLFLLPVGLGMNEWYGMGFIVPFALLMMEGAASAMAMARASEKTVGVVLAAACAIVAVVWVGVGSDGPANLFVPRGGTHFLLKRPPLTRGSEIAKAFEGLPRDTGVMAPQGFSPEIAYLTDKRVVALPFDPRLLDPFIKQYRISYLTLSGEYLVKYNSPTADLLTSRTVAEHIFRNPQRYRMVRTVQESYPAFYQPQQYFIFQVQ